MYVLEGVTPCIQSMQLQAGDTGILIFLPSQYWCARFFFFFFFGICFQVLTDQPALHLDVFYGSFFDSYGFL